MTDLKDLFELALADEAGGGARGDVATDPPADLARGKKLLARRTSRRLLGGAAATAVAAAIAVGAVAFVPTGPGAGSSHSGVATGQRTAARIRLVAYTGAQPPGYTVTVIRPLGDPGQQSVRPGHRPRERDRQESRLLRRQDLRRDGSL